MSDTNNKIDTVNSDLEETKVPDNSSAILSLQLRQLPEDPSYIGHEEALVKIWNANTETKQDLYSQMIAKNRGNAEYVFMDGPPFVSGNLHPGHVAVGSAKSAVHIYKIMKGMMCVVKLGYDCHGLPAVNKAASENNLDTLEKIKTVGLANFNQMCEQMIFKYSKSWTPLIQRLGRFADFDDVYIGHFHTPTKMTFNTIQMRISGSPESTNTYASESLAAIGRPSQPLMFVHPEKGIVTAEYNCWLDK